MAEYLVCIKYNTKDDNYYFYFTDEYDGDNPAEYFGMKHFYGGDENASPEDYIESCGDNLDSIYVIPICHIKVSDIIGIRKLHKDVHEKLLEEELEKEQRATYEMLKKKFEDG